MSNFKSKAKEAQASERVSSGALTAVLIATVLMLNVVIFVIASTLGLAFTVSEELDLSLTGNTDALFEDAISEGKKVKISFCFPTDTEVKNHSTGALVHQTAENFKERYGDFIELEYINLITRVNSKGESVAEKIKNYETDMQGGKNYFAKSSVIFECGNNYKVVTDTYSQSGYADFYTLDSSGSATSYNGEAFMASMINWVTVDEHPKAYFTVGHSEQLDRAFANLVISAGYYVDTVDLRAEEVPADAGLLIISNPLSDFEKGSGVRTELERLNSYIERGGNIYVAFDPYVKKLPVFEKFLADCGIEFSTTENDGDFLRNIVKDSENAITSDGFTLVTDFADSDIAASIKNKVGAYSDGSVIVREAAALTLSGSAKPLLITTASSSLLAGGERVDNAGGYTVAACAELSGFGERVASVFVVSSVYISVSDALITNAYANSDFLYAVFDDFYGRSGMPYGCEVIRTNTSMIENLTMGTARLYTVLIFAVPAAVLVTGTVILVRRKNR